MFYKSMVMAAGLLMASVASAQGAGAFVEGSVGYGKFDLGNTSNWSIDDKDTNWGLSAGYMFNQYLGVEAGYRDLGRATGSISGNLSGTLYGSPATVNGTVNASGDVDGWLLGVRGSLPLSEKFSLNARAGWYRWDADIKATANAVLTWGGVAYPIGSTASKTYSGTDPYYGLGASYSITRNLGVGVGYTKFDLDDIGVKIDSWDVSLSYRF